MLKGIAGQCISTQARTVRASTYSSDKLTVLRPAENQLQLNLVFLVLNAPASVMAEITRNRLSVYETLRGGVEEPQNMSEVIKHVERKYR